MPEATEVEVMGFVIERKTKYRDWYVPADSPVFPTREAAEQRRRVLQSLGGIVRVIEKEA